MILSMTNPFLTWLMTWCQVKTIYPFEGDGLDKIILHKTASSITEWGFFANERQQKWRKDQSSLGHDSCAVFINYSVKIPLRDGTYHILCLKSRPGLQVNFICFLVNIHEQAYT